ncbi:MAG: radical SAM protein [Pseudobutyrivibrio sp.]|nr:radical SAM protein [Pseudobutyrivibrio sp.]
MNNEKIYIPFAEIPVVEHCNLNCSLCNSHAYLIDESVYPLEQFKRDIDVLSDNVHFGLLTFMGGEPLLCDNLHEYIRYAKEKKVGEVYRILTNGLLVKHISPKLLEEVDVLEISRYPQMKETAKELCSYLKPLSHQYNFSFYVKEINYFNCIDSVELSDEEAQRGYDNCSRIIDGCCIFNGYFYKCMRPKTTNLYLEKEHGIKSDVDMKHMDGVEITSDKFAERLREYRNRSERLEACNYCLMGLERNCSAVAKIKHLAFSQSFVIKTFYKSNLLYYGFKKFKKLLQYDEGACCGGDDKIVTKVHEVRGKTVE